jgi:hypothetical protein
MEGYKGILQSATIWSLAVGFSATILQKFGYTIDADLQGEIVQRTLDAVQLISYATAAYGRIRATKIITPGK